ncbi:MAG: N-acetyltransferase family protein [Planctomycetota bacterium]
MIEIVKAEQSDLPGIMAIFNDAILNGVATFNIEPWDEARQLEWFRAHGGKHPAIVAREGGEVVGWGALNVFIARSAYEATVEDSVYVRADRRGRGIGRALLARLIELAREIGHHSIVARIADHAAASIELHRSLGFEEAGELRESGRKFGRWIDVTLMQLML